MPQYLADVSAFQLVCFMCADLTFESQRWIFLQSSKSIWPLHWVKGKVSAQCVYIIYSVFCIWDI